MVGAREIELTDPGTGERLTAQTAADGILDAPLPDGTWRVRVHRSLDPPLELGTLQMGRADREVRPLVPGPVVVARVLSANDGQNAPSSRTARAGPPSTKAPLADSSTSTCRSTSSASMPAPSSGIAKGTST